MHSLLQSSGFLVFLLLNGLVAASSNMTQCHDWVHDGRTFRGLELISNEGEYSRARREPRLLSFKTNDKDVDIKMEFILPFMNIPIRGTFDGLKSVMGRVMQGQMPDLPSISPVGLAISGLGLVLIAGAGFAVYSINNRHFQWGTAPALFRSIDNEDLDLAVFVQTLEKSLARYGIDSTACMQRSMCEYIKTAVHEVEKSGDNAGRLDVVVEGITRTKWAMNFVTGTAIEDAVMVARSRSKKCWKVFESCTVQFNVLYTGLQSLVNAMNVAS